MGHKIFISYKYKDNNVYQKVQHNFFNTNIDLINVTPRDYVDVLAKYLDEKSTHYCKAEDDNNDLSQYNDDTIWEELKDKIFDSTMTIVLISPNMKKEGKSEKDQWIPWEIKYSLDKNVRHNNSGNVVASNTNAMLAIVLPDRNNSYSYYFEEKKCCDKGCRLNKNNKLFKIIRDNTFNKIDKSNQRQCNNGDIIYSGSFHSYIPFFEWKEINNSESLEKAIDLAYDIQSKRNQYKISHEI